jgi:SCY1-like protein 2
VLLFVTEPIEFNLSSLQFDATKKELIPGDLEIKCLSLELLEALNFLHNNAKMIHMGLAPEHIYITTEGRLKLGGLNFAVQFSTAESLNVPLNYDLRINEYSVVPNMRFAAPEISEQSQCSINSDIYSVGTILYFLVALNKNKNPNLLNQPDITDK